MKSPVGSGTGSHLAGSGYRDRMSTEDDSEMSVDQFVADGIWGHEPLECLWEPMRQQLAHAVLEAGKLMTAQPSETVERYGEPPFCRKLTLKVPVRKG
jgi:hypothetical protein